MRIPLVFQTLDFIEDLDKKSRRAGRPKGLEYTTVGLAAVVAVILLLRLIGG